MTEEKVLAIVDTSTNLIINKIVYTEPTAINDMVFPSNVIVVDATNYEIKIGDRFENGIFSRDEEKLYKRMTTNERIMMLTEKLEIAQGALDELLMQ